MRTHRLIALLLGLSVLLPGAAAAQITPAQLRCEYHTNPPGIDVAQPRLSWVVESSQRGQKQTAYQIRAARSEAALRSGHANLWDSGRVASDETAQIPYAGQPLSSGQECWWQVRAWDRDGKPSAYTAPAHWSMGLLKPSDWHGQWIGLEDEGPDADVQDGERDLHLPASPFLRHEFTARKRVRRAILYATAIGLYEIHLNGRKVGSDYFTPGWTDFRKRVYYQTYDVTRQVRPGANAIGATLGDGWAAGYVGLAGRELYVHRPRLLAQLQLEYADGSAETVSTDGSWKATLGPIRQGDLLMGESYDARREVPGWDRPGFRATGWSSATVYPAWPGRLQAYPGDPVREEMEIKPRKVTEPKPGVFVFDLGQNMVGWARLKVAGPAGTQVRLRFAEMLNPDGTIYTANLRGARCTDFYTLKGGGPEVWEPQFTFHGFRYVELTNFPGRPDRNAVTGIVVHSDAPRTGWFSCSNPLINQLQHNVEWGQRSNFLEVPTDCPQRDERLGWMGDAQIFARTACYNRDVSAFFTKWLTDVDDAQREGAFTDVSPGVAAGAGTAAWGDAGVVVPWTVYQAYGDTTILRQHYPAMTRWIDYLETHSQDLLRPARGYGDWLAVGENTPRDVLATAYFAYSTDLLSRMAHALGKEDDARKYESLFRRICDAFDRAYVASDGRIKGDTQTCYVLALQMNLLPPEQQARAAQYLVDDIRSKGWRLATGFVGTGYLNPVLTRAGYTDVAYRLLNQDTFPSWLFSVKQGATTIWERWDGWTPQHGFQDPGMNSFNHYSFGAVDQWIYSTVAGIDTDQDRPGFRHILIHPQPGGGLTYAQARYDSIRGPIATAWKYSGKNLSLMVGLPANTTATILVPASSTATVMEGGRPADRVPSLKLIGQQGNSRVFEAGSGVYRFTVTEP